MICTDPPVTGGGETAWSIGALMEFVVAVCVCVCVVCGGLPYRCVNQGDAGRGLEGTSSSTL